MHPSERDAVGLADMPGMVSCFQNSILYPCIASKTQGSDVNCFQLVNAMHRRPVELLRSGGLLGTSFSWTHCKAKLGERLGVL